MATQPMVEVVGVRKSYGHHEVLHGVDGGKPIRDRVRLAEVECEPARRAADLGRARLRAGLVAAGHDDVAPTRGVVLRNLAAETARAADDYDGACPHRSFSFRAVR